MRFLQPGIVAPSGIIFAEKGAITPIVLPIDGVLEVDLNIANSYVIANGETLKGIRLLDIDGGEFVAHKLPLPTDDSNVTYLAMIMLRAEYGGTFTVDTDNLTVPAIERILGSALGHTIDDKRVQAFIAWHEEVPGWRVDVPDWSLV